jgi:hypothetical protein
MLTFCARTASGLSLILGSQAAFGTSPAGVNEIDNTRAAYAGELAHSAYFLSASFLHRIAEALSRNRMEISLVPL